MLVSSLSSSWVSDAFEERMILASFFFMLRRNCHEHGAYCPDARHPNCSKEREARRSRKGRHVSQLYRVVLMILQVLGHVSDWLRSCFYWNRHIDSDHIIPDSALPLSISSSSIQVFNFDASFWSLDKSDPHYASQEKVFDAIGVDVLNNSFDGYNACIFAYGQTGWSLRLIVCSSCCSCIGLTVPPWSRYHARFWKDVYHDGHAWWQGSHPSTVRPAFWAVGLSFHLGVFIQTRFFFCLSPWPWFLLPAMTGFKRTVTLTFHTKSKSATWRSTMRRCTLLFVLFLITMLNQRTVSLSFHVFSSRLLDFIFFHAYVCVL